MRWRAIAQCGREAGGSAVSFVMVLPILMVLMCAIVDLGRLTFMETELESATQTACKRVADQLLSSDSAVPSESDMAKAVLDASPSLSSFGARCSATCQISDTPNIAYQRHRFDSESGSFADEDALMSGAEIRVFSTLESGYLTPVGQLLSDSGAFSLSSQAVRTVFTSQEVARGT